MIETIFIIFFFGASLGSFLNVCAYRIPRGISVARGRSFCPACRKQLTWPELIPLLSFCLSRGMCSHCRTRISLQYPIVEFLSGATAVLILVVGGLSFHTLILMLFTLSMLLVALIDWQFMKIPNKVLLWILGLAIVLKGLEGFAALMPALIALGLSFLIVLAILLIGNFIFKKESMGMGDVKLAAFIGFVLGVPGLLLSLWLGATAGLAYVALRTLLGAKQGVVTQRIPLGSSLAFSSVMIALVGLSTDTSFDHFKLPWLNL